MQSAKLTFEKIAEERPAEAPSILEGKAAPAEEKAGEPEAEKPEEPEKKEERDS